MAVKPNYANEIKSCLAYLIKSEKKIFSACSSKKPGIDSRLFKKKNTVTVSKYQIFQDALLGHASMQNLYTA